MAEKAISLNGLIDYNNNIKATYQTKTDSNLKTTDKTIAGAINENKDKIDILTTDLNGYSFVDAPSDVDKELYLDIFDIDSIQTKVDDNITGTDKNIVNAINSNASEIDSLSTTVADYINNHPLCNHSYQLILNGTDLKLIVDGVEKTTVSLSSLSGETSVVYGDIVVSKTSIDITEGGTATFTVALDKAPTNDQVITLSKTNADVTLSATSLTFTPSNYATAQTVTITVAEDADYSNETDTITLTSPNVETKTVTVNITDNDTAPSNVPVTGVILDKNIFTISVGDTSQLTATISPSNATNTNVDWTSNNTSVATVDSTGLVTGIASGTATITVTTKDGSKTATCVYTIEAIQENTLDIRYLSLERASNQLTMPTNICEVDTTLIGNHNDVVHPSALYFPSGWNGFKYWLAITPYPKTQSAYENPCMLVSNDGDNWVTKGNVPIYPIMSGAIHNSDCHIFMEDNTMYYINRGATTDSCMIEYFTSTDGVTWSARTKIIDAGSHNYLSPSVCKYNNKYYMFVYDNSKTSVDDYAKRITVLESSAMDGTWTNVNTILCPNITSIWHLEVKIIDGGFIGFVMSGDSSGGSLYLVKFDNPFDTVVTDYITSPVVAPRAITDIEARLYKSTLIQNDNKEIELFINSKGRGTLDAFCHWTLNRGKLKVVPVTDFTNNPRTVATEYSNSSFTKLGSFDFYGVDTKYFNYEVEFKVSDVTNSHIALSAQTANTTTDYIYLGFFDTQCYYGYAKSGNMVKKHTITFKVTNETVFRFIKDNNICTLYANDRLIGVIDEKEFSSLSPNYYKRHFGVCPSFGTGLASNIENITYCKVKLKPDDAIDLVKANEQLQTEITNYSSNPSQYYAYDDFNRTNGAVGSTVNGLVYTTDTTLPSIASNMLKVGTGGYKALIDISSLDFTVFADLRPSMNGHLIYIRYTDSSNYVAVSFDGTKTGIIVMNAGTETRTTFNVFITNTTQYLPKIDVRNNKVSVWNNNQLIKSEFDISGASSVASTKIGLGSLYANSNFDSFIVKK